MLLSVLPPHKPGEVIYKSSHSARPEQSGMECRAGVSFNKPCDHTIQISHCSKFFVTCTLTSIASASD